MALLLAAGQAPPVPAPSGVTLGEALAGLAGSWRGTLEYRDYKADRWFGLPMQVTIEAVPDGRTTIRKAVFDDGPKVGTVHITIVSLLDPANGRIESASFRAGRRTEAPTASNATLTAARDATHWTIVERHDGRDDDRPAIIRETTTRDGAAMTTLKEVDFTDDAGSAWIVRNRTTLRRD